MGDANLAMHIRWLLPLGKLVQPGLSARRSEHARTASPDACALIDLLAASLEETCDTHGERMYPLLARIIDQHLAEALQSRPVRRWRNEAMDALLSLISPAVQARLSRNRSSRPACPHPGSG